MNNPSIDIDINYIKAVRTYSFIIKSDSSISDEDIRTIAINDVYPRILTRIALTTNKEGIPIFGGIGNSKDYSLQYLKSMEVINRLPYSLGLRRVAIALTASAIIRIIPLKSDINLVDVADSIEAGALKDLDKLIGILASDTQTLTSLYKSESASQGNTYKAIFISQDIDAKTIPIEAFTRITDTVAYYKGATTHEHIVIDEGYIGICIVTLSCQVKQVILKDAFIIENGNTTIDIATNITQVINELNIELGTGIIASPNQGAPELIKIPISPIRLYPNSLLDKNLQLYIELSPSIDVIEVVSQVLSPIRDKEVLMVDFYTIPLSSVTIGYSSQDLINMSRLGTRGIKGLVFGTIGRYSELTNKGPHSAVVEVDKGTLITKQEQNIINPGESAIDLKQNLILDTFHFRLAKNVSMISTSLITIRVSTLPATLEPNIWTYQFDGGSLDDLVNGLLDILFINARPSCLVAAITSPYSLQIVPHLITDDETRIVIDLINLPLGVEISTGTDRLSITPYKSGTRSINVPAIRVSSNELSKRIDNVIKTSPTHFSSAKGNTNGLEHQGVSAKLVNVREKLRSFEQCGRDRCITTHSKCGSNSYIYGTQHYYTLNDVIDIYINHNHGNL